MYPQTGYRAGLKKYITVILPALGIIIIAIMLALVWFWETNGREIYFYKELVVLNQDIRKGTIITDDMLSTEKFEANKIIENAVQDKYTIIGLEAKHFIPKKSQLHPYFFEDSELNISGNNYVVRIPNEWLYSVPNSLRRKDEIILYAINLTDKDSSSNDNSEFISTHDVEQGQQLKGLGRPILKTNVAYVKDSANREVRTLSMEDRYDGTSVISEVSVVLSLSELQIIEQSIRTGGKIIIMHTEGKEEEL